MINLIKEYKIQSTRTSFYKRDLVQFADYVLVTPDISVKDFQVYKETVSDHFPLMVEFE